jgi:hypothetical protein
MVVPSLDDHAILQLIHGKPGSAIIFLSPPKEHYEHAYKKRKIHCFRLSILR